MQAHFEGTAEGVRNEMRAFLGLDQPPTPPTSPKAAKAKPEAASQPTPSEAPATQTVAAGEAATATGPITLDNVRDLVPLVAAKQGRPKAMELLAKYGAKKGNEVQEKDWAAFITDAKALLA